jgi:catechol 2,3-dioxygenase-like lactoylglutathione lyase family enzyme
MNTLGIARVGVAVDEVDTLFLFFRDVLGLRVEIARAHFVKLVTDDGDIVELFGSGGTQPPEQFATHAVVAGFMVEDIVAARKELADAGIDLIGDIHDGTGGYRWQHFRAPDGRVYELCFDPIRVETDS